MRLDAKCKYVSRSVFCRHAWAQKRPASLTEIALKFVSGWVRGWVWECVSGWVSDVCGFVFVFVCVFVLVYVLCTRSSVAQQRLSDGVLCVETISIIFQWMNSQTLKRCHFVNIWPILMKLDAKCIYVSRSVFCRPAWAQKRPASLTEIALKFVSGWVGGWVGECVSE